MGSAEGCVLEDTLVEQPWIPLELLQDRGFDKVKCKVQRQELPTGNASVARSRYLHPITASALKVVLSPISALTHRW